MDSTNSSNVHSNGGGGAEPAVYQRDFDLNVGGGVDVEDEGRGLRGLDLNVGVNYVLNEDAVIDLTAESEEEMAVERFDLNVVPMEDETEMEMEEQRRNAPAQLYAAVLPPPPLPKAELPPSSSTFDLGDDSFFNFLSVYAFLRSFSTMLFLSPFEMEELASSMVCGDSTPLFDAIHLSLMRAVRRSPKLLTGEGSASLRSLNWDLLDSITWPVFLVEYLHSQKHNYGGQNLSELKPRDYHSLPVSSKVAVLQQLCDDLIHTKHFRGELKRRAGPDELKTRYFSSNGDGDEEDEEEEVEEEEDHTMAVSDENGDECYLCKIDGTMICCDSCPAAMHSKCVGVVTTLLPEGKWHCPECRVDRGAYPNLVKSIRGRELLGTDPHGRLFYSTCRYLLVIEYSSEEESSILVYKKEDLPGVVAALQQSPSDLHEDIIHEIREHWKFPHGDNRIADSCRASSSAEAQYVNLYEFASMTSSFSGVMTTCLNDDATSTEKKIMERELKIIQENKHELFSWSNLEMEKCGWCFACKKAEDERDCLFMSINGNIQEREKFTSEALGIDTVNGKKKHLADVLCHLIWMESRLQDLIQDHSQQWRADAVEAGDVESLKRFLLQMEANLDRRVVSLNWRKKKKYTAWKTVVATSQSVEELALQVRQLDANIRWKDIDSIKGSINM